MRRIQFALMVLFLFFVFQLKFVQAISLPPVTDMQVDQGHEEMRTIFLKNSELKDINLSLSLVHITFADDGTVQIGEIADDVEWISLSNTELSFSENQERSIDFFASPSAEVPSGGYVFGLVATESLSGSFTYTYGAVSLIFVTVGVPGQASVCEAFVRREDGSFSVTLDNIGQGILYDEGEVSLRGLFGLTFATIQSNPSYRRVFTGQTRTWMTEQLQTPWWAFGPMEYSLDSRSIVSSCPRIPAPFGWIPVVIVLLFLGMSGRYFVRSRQ